MACNTAIATYSRCAANSYATHTTSTSSSLASLATCRSTSALQPKELQSGRAKGESDSESQSEATRHEMLQDDSLLTVHAGKCNSAKEMQECEVENYSKFIL